MGQSTPINPSRAPSNRKGARSIAAELKRQVRARRKAAQQLTWSVPVGSLPDHELDQVLAILARNGITGSYERDLGFVAHFLMLW